MRLKTLFIALLIINFLALIAVVFITDRYQNATKKLQKAYEMQHKSLILADELRQSSDDLTRMARTYVLTGNTMFEKQFQMVLDIRNGVIPRPKNYNRIYWDFLTLNDTTPLLDGEKKPLRQLMKEAGFPETELELLFKSAKESDDLTHLETKAMNAVKGIFQDKNGDYTVKGKPDYKLAANIMHGSQYHKAKIAIMKPLDKFYQAFETRTKKYVDEANSEVKKLESLVATAIFLLIGLVLFSFFILLSRIVYPLEALKNSMLGLSRNDMDTAIPYHTFKDEVGDMIGSVEVFKDNALRLIQKEEKLKLAIKEAKAANHSKSVFLANMSHELRTPLNAILGFTSLLKKSQNLNKEEKENLNTIQTSGNHLLTIINEILELSKIEVGKIELVKNHFDLYKMIDDIKMMFDSRCKTKGLKFDFEIKENTFRYINSDEKRLKQILINLIGNSLKFTSRGYIHCSVKSKENKLYFEIKDSGIGISKENQTIIFKPFEQIVSNKLTKNGTGLGLAITKELIKLMGGKIKVQSQEGSGSTFSFFIEFEKSIEKNIVKKYDELEAKKILTNKELTVIVADDIKENRVLLVQILKQYNIKVIQAQDGVEVLDYLKNSTILPDLIFLDLIMPKLNGYETIKKLKENTNYQNIPIVIVSANVFAEDKQKAFELGANDFLNKPIVDNDIVNILSKHLAVNFEYENKRIEQTTENLVTLDKEFLEKLHSFAKRLDGGAIVKLMEEYNIPKNLSKKIKDDIDNFRFEDILNL